MRKIVSAKLLMLIALLALIAASCSSGTDDASAAETGDGVLAGVQLDVHQAPG